MSDVLELFGEATLDERGPQWDTVLGRQWCPFLDRKCIKVRKSEPEVSIGTCSVLYGRAKRPIVICPYRLLERGQIFTDCLHLLSMHEPGNEIHTVPEVSVPSGSVDYFLVSVRDGKVKDFVGIELQTLDTTGTVWPARQRFLRKVGLDVVREEAAPYKTCGMNWKMTAKTILVQLHHKIQTCVVHCSKSFYELGIAQPVVISMIPRKRGALIGRIHVNESEWREWSGSWRRGRWWYRWVTGEGS